MHFLDSKSCTLIPMLHQFFTPHSWNSIMRQFLKQTFCQSFDTKMSKSYHEYNCDFLVGKFCLGSKNEFQQKWHFIIIFILITPLWRILIEWKVNFGHISAIPWLKSKFSIKILVCLVKLDHNFLLWYAQSKVPIIFKWLSHNRSLQKWAKFWC